MSGTPAAELHLRLLVEDLVAALPLPVDDVARRLDELVVASLALVAVGAIDRDVAVAITRDTETALLVRGNEWMELDLGDLPDVSTAMDEPSRDDVRPPELIEVIAEGDVVVERWRGHAVVRTSDGEWMLHGADAGAAAGLQSITISMGGASREVPLTGGRKAHDIAVRAGPVDPYDLLASFDDERREVAARAYRACGVIADG